MGSWSWDETLYAGSAAFYARGRVAYPIQLIETIRDEFALDGRGRLLDAGCGPGSLTIPLAPCFEEAVGIDVDTGMVAEALRHAPPNARFVRMRAEELPAGLGSFRVATLAQSFHWMEQHAVARSLPHAGAGRRGRAVGATTHEGDGDVPREQIAELIRSFFGRHRRAGRSVFRDGTPRWEDEAFHAAGFDGPRRVDVAWGALVERSEDDVVASVFSLSSSAPHLFGERLREFERELRALLQDAPFHERMRGPFRQPRRSCSRRRRRSGRASRRFRSSCPARTPLWPAPARRRSARQRSPSSGRRRSTSPWVAR
jgi:SAM-dependent methyltransferase